MVPAQTAIEQVAFLRALLAPRHRRHGQPDPTVQQHVQFLNFHLEGRACITTYNRVHYIIRITYHYMVL